MNVPYADRFAVVARPFDQPKPSRTVNRGVKGVTAKRDRIPCGVLICAWEDQARKIRHALAHAAANSADPRFNLSFVAFGRRQSETDEEYRERLLRFLRCQPNAGDLGEEGHNGRRRKRLAATSIATIIQIALISEEICSPATDNKAATNLMMDFKRLRPLVGVLTMSPPEPKAGSPTDTDEPGIEKQHNRIDFTQIFNATAARELVQTKIVQPMLDRFEAPFWDAALSFAKRPIISCHALPAARSKSIADSPSVNDFVKFYGNGPWALETSATAAPLDSAHGAVRSLKHALKAAARAYGSDHTLFVPDGTSTAIKIVLRALLAAGDLCLLDYRAHIAHHVGLCQVGARVHYLEPLSNADGLGIPGGISPRVLASALDQIIRSSNGRLLPTVIDLTNPTTDGLLGRPRKWFEAARATLAEHKMENKFGEICWLIDEAWFAFARFHPEPNQFAALHAAALLSAEDRFYAEHLRVYVTQSTHKTLTAHRQGSMIHVRDPYLLTQES